MFELRQVTFRYPHGALIFDGLDWQGSAGESWAVLGPSGCGKTTLLYLLSGLRQPEKGEVWVGGNRLERPRPRTGLVLQDYGLLPWASVLENASLGLRIRRFYGPDGVHAPAGENPQEAAEIAGRARFWLQRLGLEGVAQQFPGQISGGQRQRTAIARTLALDPDLLLLDEPFASLDAPTREGLQDFLLELLAEKGLTLVAVTHSVEEAARLGRKVLVLGRAPTRQAQVLENPCPGEAADSETPQFRQFCAALRALLGAA